MFVSLVLPLHWKLLNPNPLYSTLHTTWDMQYVILQTQVCTHIYKWPGRYVGLIFRSSLNFSPVLENRNWKCCFHLPLTLNVTQTQTSERDTQKNQQDFFLVISFCFGKMNIQGLSPKRYYEAFKVFTLM